MLRTIARAGEIAHCDLALMSIGSKETFSHKLTSARGMAGCRCGLAIGGDAFML